MRFLYREMKDYCSIQYIAIGYNFFLLFGHRCIVVNNHLTYISDYQQEQQNVAAHKLSGPNNFTGLEDVYWNV
jgi:hypothetical protein